MGSKAHVALVRVVLYVGACVMTGAFKILAFLKSDKIGGWGKNLVTYQAAIFQELLSELRTILEIVQIGKCFISDCKSSKCTF